MSLSSVISRAGRTPPLCKGPFRVSFHCRCWRCPLNWKPRWCSLVLGEGWRAAVEMTDVRHETLRARFGDEQVSKNMSNGVVNICCHLRKCRAFTHPKPSSIGRGCYFAQMVATSQGRQSHRPGQSLLTWVEGW